MLNILGQFNQIRKPARTYLCYLLNRHLPNKLQDITLDIIHKNLEKVLTEVKEIDAGYILDPNGLQVIDNLSKTEAYKIGKGENRSDRGFFYRAVKEKKCILTDPYPSLVGGEMVVSAAMPIFNDKGDLLYVIVVDIPLEEILKFIHKEKGDNWLHNFNRIVYAIFAGALFTIVILLFIDGVRMFFAYTVKSIDIKKMFEATILITLSLALFDLVKTLLSEEVLGDKEEHPFAIHKTMIKFLGSIVIALAIEGLMLVFKFAMTAPQKLIYASMLLGAVTLLLVGLAYYMKSVGKDIK